MIAPFLLSVLAAQSPASGRSAFEEHTIATVPEGIELVGKPFVDANGVERANRSTVVWSRDGSRVAYVGFEGGEAVPVVAGVAGVRPGEGAVSVVGSPWTYLSLPVFDWSGEHVAFRAGSRTAPQAESWGVLVDDVAGDRIGVCAWIGEVAFSPDGILAWWEQPGARSSLDGVRTRSEQRLVRAHLFKDEWRLDRGKEWDDVQVVERPRFAADGETVLALVERSGRWLVLAQGERRDRELTKSMPWIQAYDCDSKLKRVAIAFRDERKSLELTDFADPGALAESSSTKLTVRVGKETFGEEADSASCPVFDPEGKHLAYKVLLRGKMDVAVEGLGADARFDHVCRPCWRPDGRELAYVAVSAMPRVDESSRMSPLADWEVAGGEWTVQWRTADSRASSRQIGPAALEIRDLTWDDGGGRLAWSARGEDGWRVVAVTLPGLEVARSELADEVGPPRFSPDGRKIAHGARVGRELRWRVLTLE